MIGPSPRHFHRIPSVRAPHRRAGLVADCWWSGVPNRLIYAVLFCSLLVPGLLVPRVMAAPEQGWEGMRVIEQLGRPNIMKRADLDGDQRQELIVVNPQSSRLDIYRWLPPTDRRQGEPAAWRHGPNDLPMAPEFQHEELQLEHVPQDVVVWQPAGQPLELLILMSPPTRLVSYTRQSGEWKPGRKYLLPADNLVPRHKPMLLWFDPRQPETARVLVSYETGIHVVDLQPNGKADWLTPRESRDRLDWWLADLDGDGDEDLLELCRDADESLRWYESVGGHLTSAAVLLDHALNGASVLCRAGQRAQPLAIDGQGTTLLRRHELQPQADHPLGLRYPLALAGGRKAIWCGMQLGEQVALVAVDKERPQLLVHRFLLQARDGHDRGWQAEQAFPAVSDMLGLIAPLAQPGTLLIWAKEASDLLICRWEQGRLSYPRPWSPPGAAEGLATDGRKLLGTGTVGETVWWAQLVQKDLYLWTWPRNQSQPTSRCYTGVGNKVEQVQWLGDERLLLRTAHASQLTLAQWKEGQTTLIESPHLKKSTLDQFRAWIWGDRHRVARIADGVLQWLDSDLRAEDQIMLPQGQKLIDFVPAASRQGWALQEDGKSLYHLSMDDNGVAEVQERIRLGGGVGLQQDPLLGLLLLDSRRVTSLQLGPAQDLQLIDVVDNRVAQAAGLKDLNIHRLDTADTDGDGKDEILLFDDIRHQITLLRADHEKLRADMAWPVFEDKKYPYDDASAPIVREPRSVVALDMDGDHSQDLALLCHDRLIIYLAKDPAP